MGGEEGLCRRNRSMGGVLEREEGVRRSVEGRVREKVWRGNESKGVGSGETGGKVEGDREIGGREEGRRAREG